MQYEESGRSIPAWGASKTTQSDYTFSNSQLFFQPCPHVYLCASGRTLCIKLRCDLMPSQTAIDRPLPLGMFTKASPRYLPKIYIILGIIHKLYIENRQQPSVPSNPPFPFNFQLFGHQFRWGAIAQRCTQQCSSGWWMVMLGAGPTSSLDNDRSLHETGRVHVDLSGSNVINILNTANFQQQFLLVWCIWCTHALDLFPAFPLNKFYCGLSFALFDCLFFSLGWGPLSHFWLTAYGWFW